MEPKLETETRNHERKKACTKWRRNKHGTLN